VFLRYEVEIMCKIDTVCIVKQRMVARLTEKTVPHLSLSPYEISNKWHLKYECKTFIPESKYLVHTAAAHN
jgi:hypothetical protein